jgi:hypothetical protein
VKNVKAKLAAAATAVALGGLTGLALTQGGKAPSRQVADRPVVHTKVIRRTIHVTRHAKPKHPVAALPVEPAAEPEAAAVVTGSSGSGEAAPVTTSSSGAGSESAPVTTASSGAGGGGEVEVDDSGGEVEHEGGDD